MIFFADLFIEAAMVGIVCFVFLLLMVYAGVRQHRQDQHDQERD
jgi:hypothetical protein